MITMYVCMYVCFEVYVIEPEAQRRLERGARAGRRAPWSAYIIYIYISLSLIYLICLSLAYILYMCVYIYLSPVVVPRGALRDKAGLCKHISLSLSLSLSIYIYIYINVISVAASLTGEQTLKF